LRREVESLLAADGAPALVDQPAMDIAAQLLDDGAPLAPGAQLGPYSIEGLIGAGRRMGKVASPLRQVAVESYSPAIYLAENEFPISDLIVAGRTVRTKLIAPNGELRELELPRIADRGYLVAQLPTCKC
jgi:hypothetical protein